MNYQEALKLESQLGAINALSVGNPKDSPGLNAEGEKLLEEARSIIRERQSN